MEKQVIYRDRQEIQDSDLNNTQKFGDEALAHTITDAITTERQIVGLVVTQKSPTEIEVGAGRLYDGTTGKVYAFTQAQTISLFSHLPLVDQKWLAVSVVGEEQETEVQPRDFIIDLQTGQTQPEAVAMERRRVTVPHVTTGIESPTPQKPSQPTGYTLIAHVLLGTTGIVEINVQDVFNLPRLQQVHAKVEEIDRWKKVTEPRITTLASDIAGLSENMKGLADRGMIRELAGDMARLKEALNLPDTFASYGADYFLDNDESDTEHPDYYARAEEGIRFPWEAQNEAPLALANPYETAVKKHDGFLLPNYQEYARIATWGYAGELNISQYQYQTHTMRLATMTRQRIRYGPTRTICTNAQEWRTGNYDPVSNVFRNANGDTWSVANEDIARVMAGEHFFMRQTQFWIDTYEEPYWYVDAQTHAIWGSQVAQTFLNHQNGWMPSIELFFTRHAADGQVYLSICETEHGKPDPNRCVATTQIDPSTIRDYPYSTKFTFPHPVYLESGKRYALLVTTAGDHRLAIVSGENFTQGTLFYSLDGEYFQGDFTKDLLMRLNFAWFDNPRTEVELSPLELPGGVADIDILAETVVPPSCELVYEYRKDGVWYPVSSTEASPLMGRPALLPLRAVFLGSSDLMPGINLSGSRTLVSRQATTFKHLSTERTTQSPTTQIEVQARLEYFNDTRHTLDCKLLINGGLVAPTNVEIRDEPGGLRKYFSFTLGTATDKYQIQFEGTAVSALDVYHVANRIDIVG